MNGANDLAGTANAFLDSYGLLAVFLVVLLKEIGIPIPIPGDVLTILIGARAAEGRLALVPALLAIVLAALIGGWVQYILARGPARGLVYRFGRYIGLKPERLDRAARAVQRRGWRGVVIGRLAPGLRVVIVAACGLAALPLRTFLLGLAVGSLLFFGLHIGLGYLVGPSVIGLLSQLNLPLWPLLLAILVVGLAGWLIRRRRRQNVAGDLLAWADASCPLCVMAGRLVERDARLTLTPLTSPPGPL